MFNKITYELSRNKNIYTIGFFGGIYLSLLENDNDFLQYPLSNLFYASFYGYFISMSSLFVADMFPKRFKFIVPISIFTSSLYYTYKKFII